MINSVDESRADFQVHAYPRSWRIITGALFAVSRASLPVILVLVVVATDPPITPPILIRLVTIFALLPGLAAWLIERAFAANVEVRTGELVVRRHDLRLEIPCNSIEDVAPWIVPLPGPGLSLRMRSGRRLRYGLQSADPTPLLLALADVGGVDAARSAAHHPSVVYAHVKQASAPRRWYHRVGKFVVFALLPTVPLFRVHQLIAYGGSLGEYYLYGLGRYLQTFAVYWTTLSIYLVLYASVWRGLAEGAALLSAWVAPSRAARVRRVAEITCQVAYYGGVPLLLVLRFLP